MLKSYTFWIKSSVVLQFLTAAIHSISFFVNPALKNETERQLHELMTNYYADMGAGFHRSFLNLFTALSACLPLLCILGGLTLGYLLWKQAPPNLMKGVIGINLLVFGVLLVVVFVFAFLPPVICVGLIVLNLLIAYLLAPRIESAV